MSTKHEVLSLLEEIKTYNESSENKTDEAYKYFYFQKYLRCHGKQEWNKEIILDFLKKAFSKGFHGIHFIALEYEPCIDMILEKYFGTDHYIGYRVCKTHDKIILTPNYAKLEINPNSYLTPSFAESKLKCPYNSGTFADFCFQ